MSPPRQPGPPVSDTAPAGVVDRVGTGLPRRFGVLLALVPVVAVGLADAVIAVRTASAPAKTHASSHVVQNERPPDNPDAQRAAALRRLLDERAAAVLHHDRASFLATVDPQQPKFLAQQQREYAAVLARSETSSPEPPSKKHQTCGSTVSAARSK